MECVLISENMAPDIANEDSNSSSFESGLEQQGEVDILIHNVMACFEVKSPLDLKKIGRNANNVEHQNGTNTLTMRLRSPKCTARISSKGNVTVVGLTSEEDAKRGARRCARIIQKIGFNVKFVKYQVVNVLGTCLLPFGVRLRQFYEKHRRLCCYEPLIHQALTLTLREASASIQIYYTGKMTILAPSVADVQAAVELAYSLVEEFKRERSPEDFKKLEEASLRRNRFNSSGKRGRKRKSQTWIGNISDGVNEFELGFDMCSDNDGNDADDDDDDENNDEDPNNVGKGQCGTKGGREYFKEGENKQPSMSALATNNNNKRRYKRRRSWKEL